MPKIRLEGYILVPNSDLASVISELPNHIALTLQEKGCLLFRVSQDDKDLNRFSVYEEFINQQAFDLHQLRVSRSKWGRITSNVERHYEITSVE